MENTILNLKLGFYFGRAALPRPVIESKYTLFSVREWLTIGSRHFCLQTTEKFDNASIWLLMTTKKGIFF